MKYSKKKMFWKTESDVKKIFFVDYDDKQEYYSFIRKMIAEKCHQIAITSDIMLSYIEDIASMGNIQIEKIEMMEEDGELTQKIDYLVSRCENNRGTIVELVKILKHLDEDSSVEIKRIYLRENQEGNTILGYIQVNGIVGISTSNSHMINALLRCVERCLC